MGQAAINLLKMGVPYVTGHDRKFKTSGAKLREKRYGYNVLFVVFKYFRHLLHWKFSYLRYDYIWC
jgi:hypothetical protein